MTDKQKAIQGYDEETPDSFLTEVMYECEGVTRAEMLTIRKQAAVHAQNQVLRASTGYEKREWRSLSFELRSNRI
jgi:hypothetical protein